MSAQSPAGTVRNALEEAAGLLRDAGVESPVRESRLLLAWLLGTDSGGIVARLPDPMPDGSLAGFRNAVTRRASREPLQYITGEQEFLGLEFGVDPRALIPRPETEEVVEAALALAPASGGRVADLGTGSGCIAVSIAAARPDLELLAVDLSAGALELAAANARRHDVAGRIEFLLGSLDDTTAAWRGETDLVVSNPPYVSAAEWETLQPEVRDHEPRAALVPGPTGLEAYPEVAGAARDLLVPGGRLVLELGHDSEKGARKAVKEAGFEDPEVRPDLRGIPRILLAVRGTSR